jgi:hypothetical protein
MDFEEMYNKLDESEQGSKIPNAGDEGTPGGSEGTPPEDNEEGEGSDHPEGEEGSEGAGDAPQPSSVINSFLERYGVENGTISYQDGTTAVFSELPVEEQLEVLETLAQSTSPSVESEYGLVQEEIDVLNAMRNNNLTFDEIVDQVVASRLQEKELNSRFGAATDFSKVATDDIYRTFLQEQNPEYTPEEIEEDLALAKENKTFDVTVNILRGKYQEQQDKERATWLTNQKFNEQAELENDKKEIVTAVSGLTEIAGWPIDDDMKNEVLEDLVETDAKNQSKFMREVLSDPIKMFEAAWYIKNGPALFARLDAHYKEEVRKAKQGTPATPKKVEVQPESQSFNKRRQPEIQPPQQNPAIKKNIPEKFISLEDFAGQ